MEDSSKKLGALFWKLNSGDVSEVVGTKLLQLCQVLDAGDFVTATHLQVRHHTLGGVCGGGGGVGQVLHRVACQDGRLPACPAPPASDPVV